MKNLVVALSLFFISGCATNGSILDPVLRAETYNKARTSFVESVYDIVPVPVKEVVDTVVYEALTPFDQKVKDCEDIGGKMGASEHCSLPKDK